MKTDAQGNTYLKQDVRICTKAHNGALIILRNSKLWTRLADDYSGVITKYKRKEYPVLGTALFSYIVIEDK